MSYLALISHRSSHTRRVASVIASLGLALASLSGTAPASATLGSPTAVPASRVNTWTPTGTMAVVRTGATATLLASGDVLVAGGGTAKAELYDPATRSFSPAGAMSVARTNATATLLVDGDVLVAGGAAGGRQTTTADLYSPSDGTWTPTAPMRTARSGQTASLLPNGDVLVAGGGCNANTDCDAGDFLETLSSTEIYDPSTATWTDGPDMAAGREYATATTLPDGQVLVAGGFSTCDDDFCKDTPSVQVYDPTTGSWTSTAHLHTPRQRATATLLATGRVLVAGGTIVNGDTGRARRLREVELYDPTSGHWSRASAMPEDHSGASAALLPNKWAMVTGGGTAASAIYQPAQNRWVHTGPMNSRRTDAATATLPSGDILATGGGSNTAEIYRAGRGALVGFSPGSLHFGTLGVSGVCAQEHPHHERGRWRPSGGRSRGVRTERP